LDGRCLLAIDRQWIVLRQKRLDIRPPKVSGSPT
jgi:hypothetical protein